VMLPAKASNATRMFARKQAKRLEREMDISGHTLARSAGGQEARAIFGRGSGQTMEMS
jgi:hypothetical protein